MAHKPKRETTDEHRPSPFTKPASVSVEDAGSHYSQLHGIRTPISASASDKGSAGGVVGTSLKLPFSMIGSSSGSSTPEPRHKPRPKTKAEHPLAVHSGPPVLNTDEIFPARFPISEPGAPADANPKNIAPDHPAKDVSRPLNPAIGQSENSSHHQTVMYNTSTNTTAVTASTPLLQNAQMVTGTGNSGSARVIQQLSGLLCSKRAKCWLLLSASLFVLLVIIPTLWATTAISTSSSAIAYGDDVVLVDPVPGYWYNQISLSYNVLPDAETTNLPELNFEAYYTEHPSSAIENETYNYNSPTPHNFSYPQIIIVDDSDQNYLLEGSKIEFNFSVLDPSEFAKICQFSSYPDYVRDSKTNKSIIEAEKRGYCQLLLDSPNTFGIRHNGYYWYVVSTLLSPDPNTVNLRTNYTYRLNKLYYNRTMLGSPHDCTVTESDPECIVADSLFLQQSTKHVLAFVAGGDGYKFKLTKKYAVGIALVVFLSVETLALLTSLLLCACVLFRKCTQH